MATKNRELLVKARIHLVLSLFLILNALCLAAQDADAVFRDLASTEKQPFQEKLYLHIDKPLYSGVPIDSARASMINLDALESIEVLRSGRYLFSYNLFNESEPRVVFIMTTKPGAKGYAFSRPSLRTDTKLINPQGF